MSQKLTVTKSWEQHDFIVQCKCAHQSPGQLLCLRMSGPWKRGEKDRKEMRWRREEEAQVQWGAEKVGTHWGSHMHIVMDTLRCETSQGPGRVGTRSKQGFLKSVGWIDWWRRAWMHEIQLVLSRQCVWAAKTDPPWLSTPQIGYNML